MSGVGHVSAHFVPKLFIRRQRGTAMSNQERCSAINHNASDAYSFTSDHQRAARRNFSGELFCCPSVCGLILQDCCTSRDRIYADLELLLKFTV